MKTKARAALALTAALWLAALPHPIGAEATVGPSAVSSVPRSRASCQRDTAADLRWIAWIHRANSGIDPSMAEAALWLADIAQGHQYRAVARAIAAAPVPTSTAVTRLYQDLLGRDPSPAEVTGWSTTLRAHGSAHVVPAFVASAETYARAGSTDVGWLDRAYELVMGRAPDSAGRAYWLGRLAGGTSRTTVAASLWNAPQSQRRRVDSSYRRILGRPGDPGGMDHWSAVAAAEGDEALDAALASTQAGWNLAQTTYGAPASPMPAPCPPVARWTPAGGTVVRTLPTLTGRGSRLAALTFDDGPHPAWTPQILDVLDRYDVPATFFVVGNQARRHPELVRRTLAEGHHLAVHTMTHPDLTTLGPAAQRREIAGSVAVVDDIVGPGHVRCFRPPYGNRNATTDQIAAELGLATVMWSRDGRDWASPGIDHIVQANLDTRYDGGRALLLLHDGGDERSQTVAALPRLIEALAARGYEFVQIC